MKKWLKRIREPEETGCDPRFQADWSQTDRAGIDLAIIIILDHGCDVLGNKLVDLLEADRIAIWSARITRFSLLTGSSDDELDVVRVWDGSTAETSDPPINWAKSLAHEASHLVNTQYTFDSQHTAAAAECF
ncbi:MAG: hypothetical protein IIC36_04930 [Gemmatimonadetes bacterium]|nr:hypothetical protein [Gemmatimonadota bacterium]